MLTLCATLRPLQLDEVLQLLGTRTPRLPSVFDWMRYSPGSVPGGYVTQWALMRMAGFSNVVARLPSIAAWALTVFAMLRIGMRMGMRRVDVLAMVTAVTPMLFRYAIEGRPYLPAFCLMALATMMLLQFVDMADGPAFWQLGVYALLLATAPLMQGTAASVTLAHALFVLTDRSMRRNRSRQIAIGAAIVVSLGPPIAWSLHMRGAWAAAIVHDGYTFTFGLRTAGGFLKDISGGGLTLTALLIAGACWGLVGPRVPRSAKYLLSLTVLTAICGALASDAVAGYFTSPRQAIYSLCGLVTLGVAGWERFRSRFPLPAMLALGLFASVSLAKDVSVVRSKENWQDASQMIVDAVGQGFCVEPASNLTAPLNLYSFFNPAVEAHRCTAGDGKVALVHSIFTPRADRDAAAATLAGRGFVRTGTSASGGTTLERYIKAP